MIIIKKNVYYCEYCKKHQLRSVAVHEKHCTLNPNRECRMCHEDNKDVLDKYKDKKVQWPAEKAIEDLRIACGGCPACMLWVIRVNKLTWVSFNYQEESEKWWAENNQE